MSVSFYEHFCFFACLLVSGFTWADSGPTLADHDSTLESSRLKNPVNSESDEWLALERERDARKARLQLLEQKMEKLMRQLREKERQTGENP